MTSKVTTLVRATWMKDPGRVEDQPEEDTEQMPGHGASFRLTGSAARFEHVTQPASASRVSTATGTQPATTC